MIKRRFLATKVSFGGRWVPYYKQHCLIDSHPIGLQSTKQLQQQETSGKEDCYFMLHLSSFFANKLKMVYMTLLPNLFSKEPSEIVLLREMSPVSHTPLVLWLSQNFNPCPLNSPKLLCCAVRICTNDGFSAHDLSVKVSRRRAWQLNYNLDISGSYCRKKIPCSHH